MSVDRPILGIVLMLGFCALAPLGDGMAKLIGASVPLGELLLVRFAIQALLLLPIAVLTGRSLRMQRGAFVLTVCRTLLHMLGIGAMFLALRHLELADAIAIAFVMPFLMLLLGKYVLAEEIGPRRLAACVAGFAGTLLVIQPNFASTGAPALLPLLVAFAFALFMLVTRKLAREVDAISLQALSGLLACAALVPVLTFGHAFGIADFRMIIPDQTTSLLLLAVGVLGTGAHLLMTWALRFAPSATLAPMQYLEIPFATLIGWLMFQDLPGGIAILGILTTVASGLYVLSREHRLARAMASPAPTPTGR